MKLISKYGKVSVVITTFKRPVEVLTRAIESVLNQTYKDIEIIVVDDNVDDLFLTNNKECVKKYSLNDVKYLKNDKTHGACVARNMGAAHATGAILAFLDDDDTWTANKLETMVPELSQKVGLVYCNSNYLRNDKIIRNNVSVPKQAADNVEALLLTNYIGGCSMPILSLEIFRKAGMFDERFPASQDLDLWIRVVQITEIKHVEIPLVNYYLSDDSITRNLERQNNGRAMILRKYSDLFDKYPVAKEMRIFTIALTEILQGHYKKGLSFYNENSESSGLDKMIAFVKLTGKGTAKRIINKIKGYN